MKHSVVKQHKYHMVSLDRLNSFLFLDKHTCDSFESLADEDCWNLSGLLRLGVKCLFYDIQYLTFLSVHYIRL